MPRKRFVRHFKKEKLKDPSFSFLKKDSTDYEAIGHNQIDGMPTYEPRLS